MNTENASREDPGVEEVLEEIVDLEEYAKRGERPPLSKGYRIRVNGEAFVVHDPTPTGREILTLAGLLPAEDYTLREKLAGERPRKIELDHRPAQIPAAPPLPRRRATRPPPFSESRSAAR